VLAEIAGAGVVNHIWVTIAPTTEINHGRPGGAVEPDFLRRLVLRVYWDGQEHPSLVVPIGDFFGVGHGRTTNFVSAPLQMSPENGRSFNCFFHMPFAAGARFEITSELETDSVYFYYYIDYEELAGLEDGLGRFHAQWRRENPTGGIAEGDLTNHAFQIEGENLTGDGNYVILDASGRGHYVGCVLNIVNLRETDEWNWYGEGDDMIFIDGEPFPPSLHGTGTEDYFNTAWCPTQAYSAPYHGITLPGGANWSGEISLYRFHVEDPIMFDQSIRVTIEHGHANRRSDDFSSVAYWYQELPTKPFDIAPATLRLATSK
jgi:hypothetical protein